MWHKFKITEIYNAIIALHARLLISCRIFVDLTIVQKAGPVESVEYE